MGVLKLVFVATSLSTAVHAVHGLALWTRGNQTVGHLPSCLSNHSFCVSRCVGLQEKVESCCNAGARPYRTPTSMVQPGLRASIGRELGVERPHRELRKALRAGDYKRPVIPARWIHSGIRLPASIHARHFPAGTTRPASCAFGDGRITKTSSARHPAYLHLSQT